MIIPSGMMLMLDHGESDDDELGPYRVIRDIDQEVVRNLFLIEWTAERDRKEATPWPFADWLIRHGYVEEVPAHHWYIGSGVFYPTIE